MHDGERGEQGKATPGTNSEHRLDKGFVNQAAEQTIRRWGRREEGGAREATNFIMMGLVTMTFCPLNNLGLPSRSTVSEKKPEGGRERVPVRREQSHL